MPNIEQVQRVWEHLAIQDPLWAILADPKKTQGKWDKTEFFATGGSEISTVMRYVNEKSWSLDFSSPALDFGCGVGRLTQALASYFPMVHGVDISPSMIEQAKGYNRYPVQCQYHLNSEPHLGVFASNSFSFVYSSIVLQHMETRLALGYIKEFVRLLKPGGLAIFQTFEDDRKPMPLPRKLWIQFRMRMGLRTRLKRLVGKASPPSSELEMPMYSHSEQIIRKVIHESGARLLDVVFTNSTEKDFNGRLEYFTEGPGLTSKQYMVTKA